MRVLSLNTRFECEILRGVELNKQTFCVYLISKDGETERETQWKIENESFISNFTADKNFNLRRVADLYTRLHW